MDSEYAVKMQKGSAQNKNPFNHPLQVFDHFHLKNKEKSTHTNTNEKNCE